MSDKPEIPESHSIGGQFGACQKCGELSSSSALFCKFCGSPMTTAAPESRTASPEIPAEPRPENAVHEQRDSNGRGIPTEYYPGFHPECFSWPAFWFADLWHAEKGLLKIAGRHFVFRLLSSITGAALLILLIYWAIGSSEKSFNPAVGFAVLALILIWLGSIGINFLLSYMDATSAHRRYCELLNSTSGPERAKTMSRGESAYWWMLYFPLAMYLMAFVIMLLVVQS